MNATDAGTIFTGFIGDVGAVLTDNLPLVVGILAALIGLGLLVRYTKRWVGRK